jgi:photosystem II stability/assembly factor-like uncharacterized protein
MKTAYKKYCILVILPMVMLAIALVFFILKSDIFQKDKEGEEEREEEGFDRPEGFNQFYHLITTPIGQEKNEYTTNYAYFALRKAMRRSTGLKVAGQTYYWVSRGPGNVSGRTRSVIIDPDDHTNNTWYAAAVSGGIWKTKDGGQTWQNLTDQQLANLATNTMTMAPSNHNIIYAGTGEGYGGVGMVMGNGIYKTIDRGITWDFLSATLKGNNFQFVNKILVDPNDANVLIAATNTGIFKSMNGGDTWDTVYFKGNEVQDLAVNPFNTNTVYAAVNGLGIIKSYNNGNTWVNAFNGIGSGGRFAVTVSPLDSNFVFTSVEGPHLLTDVYISNDGALNWHKLNDFDKTFTNFLGSQGWFNNYIKSNPFNKNKVFIGGVKLGSIEFNNTTSTSSDTVMRVDTIGTESFISFIQFGGNYFDGAMSTGIDQKADVLPEDFVSVEIRFGPGISQNAYRFTVPAGMGEGVPADNYIYNNYTSVPFQAWDTKNNRQLMVSFRDQERDGSFNLIKRLYGDNISGREYIFVHSLSYSTTPDTNIARKGGENYKMLYFFWPTVPDTFPDTKIWQGDSLPQSKLVIQYGAFTLQNATTSILADSTRNVNLHVDHHSLNIVVTDSINLKFRMLDANDGGLGLSDDGGLSWEQIKKGYINTQFYGVAKKPGAQVYIGGMQDNGTWQSPDGLNSNSSSDYSFKIPGDGFEALWNSDYPTRILGSSYNNRIKLSMNGGDTWADATNGITTDDGPFITHLSNSPKNPNLVFAVGSKGVYRNNNFAAGRFPWEMVEIGHGWAVVDNNKNNFLTSAHNVKVSLADPKIVWAGAGMYTNPDLRIFLSKDYGQKFDSVRSYTGKSQMGYITTIATHPTDTGTAYLLFSMSKKPKILRTTNFGQTWEDITGFVKDTSINGFPNVMVYSLLVLPDGSNTIWAGTEIGIFELTNSTGNWHLVQNSGLPRVSVWQMFVQDNAIVIATHGRGIWTASLYPDAIDEKKLKSSEVMLVYPNPTSGMVNINLTSDDIGSLCIRVYDNSGKLLRIIEDSKDQVDYSSRIELGNLPRGNYFLNVTIGKTIYNSRIILQ